MDFALTKEQRELKERVAEFSQREIAPRAEALDRDGVFPTDLFHKLGDLGVLSIPFEEKWGGMGLGVMEATLALEEVDPSWQRQLGHAGLGDAGDGVRRGRVEAPGGVARLDLALGRKAQDHLLGLGVGDDALEQAVEHEVLLHLVHALVQQEVALAAVDDVEQVFDLAPLVVGEVGQHDVLPELQADDVAFGVLDEQRHRVGSARRARGVVPLRSGVLPPCSGVFRKLTAVNGAAKGCFLP